MSQEENNNNNNLTKIFNELAVKFFINLPESELLNTNRLFIQLQQAYWYYHDYYLINNNNLPKYNEKSFIIQFFSHSEILKTQISGINNLYNEFKLYLSAVPVCGGILLSKNNNNETVILMVQSYGKKSTWGFPRGKVDANETHIQCAIREIYEEIGYDCKSKINNNYYIDAVSKGKYIKLFIMENIPYNTEFKTNTNFEIQNIQWIPINALPTKQSPNGSGEYKFGNVQIFAIRLHALLKRGRSRKQHNKPKERQHLHTQSTSTSNTMSIENMRNNTNSGSSSASPLSPTSQARRSAKKQNKPRSHSAQQRSTNDNRTRNGIDNNALTFGDEITDGWDAEQMFAVNEKLFGVKSTVPVDDDLTNVPENIDAILESVLGNRGTAKKKHVNKTIAKVADNSSSVPQSPAHRLPPKSAQHVVPHSSSKLHKSSSLNINKSKSQRSLHLPESSSTSNIDTLDFSHNPHFVTSSYHNATLSSSEVPPSQTTASVSPKPALATDSVDKPAHTADDSFRFDVESIFQSLPV